MKAHLLFFVYGGLLFSMLTSEILFASDGGVLDLHLYVVCLDGVGSSGVENMSRVVEGVVEASGISKIHYPVQASIEDLDVDIHVDVVTDWVAYKILVENSANVLIVNGHGGTLPIPAGYTKEEWIAKVAYAVSYRNITWAHIAGYPFNIAFHQETGEALWGEEGFKRFMSYIGKSNVTCRVPVALKDEYTPLTPQAQSLLSDWNLVNSMKMDNPISSLDVPDVLMLSLYSYISQGTGYNSGAIITFTKFDVTEDFGFYIHLAGGETYDSSQSSRDFAVGYVAGASAIWTNAMKTKSLNAISEAGTAITEAEMEGRVKGLDEAKTLLKGAKDAYIHHYYVGYDGSIPLAQEAKNAANEAVTPSLLDVYVLPIAILSVIGAFVMVSFIIRWRNRKARSQNQQRTKKMNL